MCKQCVTSVWQGEEKQKGHVKLTTTFYFLEDCNQVSLSSEFAQLSLSIER